VASAGEPDSLRPIVKFNRDQLDLQHNVAQFWDAGLSDSQNFTRYVEKQILQPLDAPFVLAIDEADILFQSEFLYDFFGMLRSWHNARANPLKKKTWKKLDLVLVTSTEPYLFIDRDHESPFNVGEVQALSDFTQPQVQELNTLHDAPLFPPVDLICAPARGRPRGARFQRGAATRTPGGAGV
jgi:hypothetical protein